MVRLPNYGITNACYNSKNSYLTNRKQCVQTNCICSDYQEVTSGVPQCSILGSLLFPNVSKTQKYFLFAYDTTIICTTPRSFALTIL